MPVPDGPVADGPVPDGAAAGRNSPPTERVVAVLEFLAAHPDERFGLSELGRRVDISKPTCLGILTTLTAGGYLVRDDGNGRDKTYRLGPALIALGHRAQESLRVSPDARTELRTLSDEFGTAAAVSAVIGDRITVLDLVGPRGADTGVTIGQSYPFAPPVGLMFVLWDPAALRAWLAKAPTVPLRTDSARLALVVDSCRSAGYLVERLTPAGRRLYSLMAGVSGTLPDELVALLRELVADIGERVYLPGEAPSARHDVSVISAPVYDHHQRQAMVMSLHIGHALTDDEISERARALVAAADRITARAAGNKPVFEFDI
ncbi:MAG: helix-turn-helix domain-containing protein [Paludibaculum sp.]